MINYGGNKMPEFLTCAHEESAVGIGHGYFKVAGTPLMALCHGYHKLAESMGWWAKGPIKDPAELGSAPDPIPAEAFTAFVRSSNRAMPPYQEAVLPDEDLATFTPICNRYRSHRITRTFRF